MGGVRVWGGKEGGEERRKRGLRDMDRETEVERRRREEKREGAQLPVGGRSLHSQHAYAPPESYQPTRWSNVQHVTYCCSSKWF